MFVIRDYKLRAEPPKNRRRGPVALFATLALLTIASGGVVYSVDLREVRDHFNGPPVQTDPPLSESLDLPPAAGSPLQALGTQATGLVTPNAASGNATMPPSTADLGMNAEQSPIPTVTAQEADAETVAFPADDAKALLVPRVEENVGSSWVEHRVAKGDSLAKIFDRQGLDASLLHRIVTSSQAASTMARIRPGQQFRFQFDENRDLIRLELHRNPVESLHVDITDDSILVQEVSKSVETRIASSAGLIESSLFLDGQKAGLSDAKIMELATIFGWDIDFALEIRAGDQFRVLYEEQFLDGVKLRDGPIIAAEFTNRGTTYQALRYQDQNGEIGYFDTDGHSKRRAFIRTPIKFARISSRYNPRRWHPVLKKWRSHKGVDYAAPTGTPVKATGDGRVAFRGTKGGYGRTVILEHGGKYTTLYAHLSRYSKRSAPNKSVKQGQVIGYVGKSGLATGPHLHYEFRVHGGHRDPLRVKLPRSLALPKAELANFRETAAPLLARLEQIIPDTLVASAGSRPPRNP